jgi:hypothetical protein
MDEVEEFSESIHQYVCENVSQMFVKYINKNCRYYVMKYTKN